MAESAPTSLPVTMEELYLKTRDQWRRWLAGNHDKSAGVWLVFFKKHSAEPSLQYHEAVEEALCFGWIDSVIKKRDEDSYLRKLTPRNADSRWSELNKARAEKLIERGLMREAGLVKIREAKNSGTWERSESPRISFDMPEELAAALRKNNDARRFFDGLAPSYRKQFIGWIAVAKRQVTKQKRVAESIALLQRGKKLGLK